MPLKYDDRNLGSKTKIKIGDEYIGNLYSIGDLNSSKNVIDITPYGADHKSYAVGICDPGTLDLELSESAIRDGKIHNAYYNNEVINITIEFPSGGYMKSEAVVSAYGKSVKIDDVVRTHATLQLSGSPQFGDTVLITGNTIIERGDGLQLTANCPVIWSIVSITSDPSTKISPDGYVTYGHNETATHITVKALSPKGDERLFTITAAHEPLRIIPDKMLISRGGSRELSATQPVRLWSIESIHHEDTIIDHNNIYISENETSEGIWIRCESTYDESAFAFIRIIKNL